MPRDMMENERRPRSIRARRPRRRCRCPTALVSGSASTAAARTTISPWCSAMPTHFGLEAPGVSCGRGAGMVDHARRALGTRGLAVHSGSGGQAGEESRLTKQPRFWRGCKSSKESLVSTSADHVGQQAEEARALDRLGEFTLLLGRDGGDARRHDLAALGDVARAAAACPCSRSSARSGPKNGQVLRRRKNGRRGAASAPSDASPPALALIVTRTARAARSPRSGRRRGPTVAAIAAIAAIATSSRSRRRACASSPTGLPHARRRGRSDSAARLR